MPAPSFAARRHAAAEVVAQTYPIFSWVVVIILTLQVLMFLQVGGIASWETNALVVMPPCLLIAAMLAAARDSDCASAWRVPANVIFASMQSAFGIDRKQRPAWKHNVWMLVQGIPLIVVPYVIGSAFPDNADDVEGHTADEAVCRKDGVPPWMPCSKVDSGAYRRCIEKNGFLFSGICSTQPLSNTLNRQALILLVLLSSSVCALWTLLCSVSSCCRCRCVWSVPRDDEAIRQIEALAGEIDRKVEEGKDAVFDSPASIYFETFMYLVDFMMLDPISSATLFYTKNYCFGTVGVCIYAKTLWMQYRQGSLQQLRREVADSVQRGLMTDGLFFLLQSEKLQEAPMAALLQYYSFLYITFSDFGIATFTVSITLAVRSIVKGAYIHYHLGIDVFNDQAGTAEEEDLLRT